MCIRDRPMKKLVDEIVDQMARLPTVDACYQTWWELQCQVEDYYSEGKKRLRPPLSQQDVYKRQGFVCAFGCVAYEVGNFSGSGISINLLFGLDWKIGGVIKMCIRDRFEMPRPQ